MRGTGFPPILWLALSLLIVSSSAAAQTYSDTIPDVHFAIIRLDFQTHAIKGAYEFSQPYRKVLPEGTRDGNVFWQYRPPADFGDLKVFSRLTGSLLVDAETIWNGLGDLLFPPDSLYDTTVELGYDNPEPDTLIYRSFGYYYSTPEGADSAWARAHETDAIHRLAARGGYEVFLFDHFYRVGLEDPTTAERIVVAFTRPPAPYDMALVETVWPKCFITRNVRVRPVVRVHNFGDDPDESTVRMTVSGTSAPPTAVIRTTGPMQADESRDVDFGAQTFPDLDDLTFRFELIPGVETYWMDLYPENDTRETVITVTGQPVFRHAGSIPLYGAPLDLDGDGDVDLVDPDGVFWENDGTGRFTDVTDRASVSFRPYARDVLGGDFTGDGLADLLVIFWNDPPQLFVQDGSGAFRDFTGASGLSSCLTWHHALVLNKDGDSDLDIIFPQQYGQDLVLENDGSGHFTDVTAASGLVNTEHTSSMTAGDLNNDGHPDVALTNWDGNPKIFINDGSGHFTHVPKAWNVDFARDVVLFDQNVDGYLDVLLVQQEYYGSSRLFRNNGNLTFTEVTTSVGGVPGGFRVDFGDINGDDRDDLVFDSGKLLLNLPGGLVDSTALVVVEPDYPTGDAWFLDLDEDGDLDIYGMYGSYLNQGMDGNGDEPVPAGNTLPGHTLLRQNRPNPFNPTTLILFEIPRSGLVDLSVYDVTGRRVRTLVSGFLPAGPHNVEWDGRNDRGRPSASGIYFYRLAAGEDEAVRKMILLR
jgi:hypothetical protein